MQMQALHITVSNHHDWLDYFAAIGGIVGAFAAVVALIFAGLSKQDAARSADAAEATRKLADEEVGIMRTEADAAEHERGRRASPEIQISARGFKLPRDGPPLTIILTLGFSNENGTRPVERVTVNLRVPNTMTLRECKDEYGNIETSDNVRPLSDLVVGDHRGAFVWHPTIGPIDRGVYIVRYLKLDGPRAGTHRIEAELVHRDLPGGRSLHAWTLVVPEAGDGIDLEPSPS
jgi:hypothetical protein